MDFKTLVTSTTLHNLKSHSFNVEKQFIKKKLQLQQAWRRGRSAMHGRSEEFSRQFLRHVTLQAGVQNVEYDRLLVEIYVKR